MPSSQPRRRRWSDHTPEPGQEPDVLCRPRLHNARPKVCERKHRDGAASVSCRQAGAV